MLECFFEKLEKQSGIIISDEMKDRIKKSKEKIELESRSDVVARDIIKNGEKVTVLDSKYNIALRNICNEIADCCLYPKKQEIIMDEWISKYKEIKNGVEQVNADTRNEQLNELANMLPLEILKNEDLLQIFWSKIDDAGIEISENEKKLIVNLMNDVEQNAPNSKEFKGFINAHCSNEEQIYSRILSKNLELPKERANLDETISNYCLYQINQENVIAEWCKEYVELEKTLEQCSKEERKIKLNELATKFPEKIFIYQDREFIQQFWNEIINVGINLTEEDKEIIQGVVNNIDVETNGEMSGFMMLCGECSQGETASRILCKGLQDGVILNKTISEITYMEKVYIMGRLDTCKIQRENYRVQMGDVPYVQITKRDSLESISQRIKEMPHITAKNMAMYETSFLTIQESETIGEYIERMGECVSLIDRYIRGEDIEFNEYGQSVETTRETIQTEQSRQNLLESAIEATIDAKITTAEKDTAKKTIISIENAKNRENEISQNNGEISN